MCDRLSDLEKTRTGWNSVKHYSGYSITQYILLHFENNLHDAFTRLSDWDTAALLSAALCSRALRSASDCRALVKRRRKAESVVIRWKEKKRKTEKKERHLVEFMDPQQSVGGLDESVLLCGRWFGSGNKCGHSQTFRLIGSYCCCTVRSVFISRSHLTWIPLDLNHWGGMENTFLQSDNRTTGLFVAFHLGA